MANSIYSSCCQGARCKFQQQLRPFLSGDGSFLQDKLHPATTSTTLQTTLLTRYATSPRILHICLHSSRLPRPLLQLETQLNPLPWWYKLLSRLLGKGRWKARIRQKHIQHGGAAEQKAPLRHASEQLPPERSRPVLHPSGFVKIEWQPMRLA